MERLQFLSQYEKASFIAPNGELVEKRIEIRTDPVTGRTSRITFARADEKEPGTDDFPPPPPAAQDMDQCPFCLPQLDFQTPGLPETIASEQRQVCGSSVLFPNLFPYGSYSAVSLIGDRHYLEIGKAAPQTYADSFQNCQKYLARVQSGDPAIGYTAITQNHLPAAGGSLVHPHLQVFALHTASNHFQSLISRVTEYYRKYHRFMLSDYLHMEVDRQTRQIGHTGDWHWLAAFAPEGFYEIWAILPEVFSIQGVTRTQWQDLSQGVIQGQKFFRSLNRNAYNLGLLCSEDPESRLELRLRMLVRSNYAPWARNDHTGFEVMLGDMATFWAPEKTAEAARSFW